VILRVEDQDGHPIAQADAMPDVLLWVLGVPPHADKNGMICVSTWTNIGIVVSLDSEAGPQKKVRIPWQDLRFGETNRVVFDIER
jgi:hypothetical protein